MFSRRNSCLTDVHSTFGLFFLRWARRRRAYARREQVIGDDRSRSILVVISRTTSVRQFPRRDSLPVGVGRCRVVLTARTRGGRSDFFRHRGFLPSVAFLPFPIGRISALTEGPLGTVSALKPLSSVLAGASSC
jgi:hypothetical protein